MPDFLKLLKTEADPQLSDKRNEVLNNLLLHTYDIHRTHIIFKTIDSIFWDGVATLTTSDNMALQGLFIVYIFKRDIYISIFTLDMVKLLDARSDLFFKKLTVALSRKVLF